VVDLSGGSVVVFWTRIWYLNGSRTRATFGGGWCYLGQEPGVCWGDFFWRQSLLHGSMVVVASSCLHFWVVKVFRVFGGCMSVAMSLFLLICLLFAPITYHVYCLIFCALVSDGPVIFASRSEVGV
jgi:hypothetical protein